MKFISFKHLLIGLFMFAAAGMALGLKPTEKIADAGPAVDLETLIPKQFGEWMLEKLAAERGLQDYITFPGFQSGNSLLTAMSTFDIGVIPDPKNVYNDKISMKGDIRLIDRSDLSRKTELYVHFLHHALQGLIQRFLWSFRDIIGIMGKSKLFILKFGTESGCNQPHL